MTHFPESSYSWSLLLICLLLTAVCVIVNGTKNSLVDKFYT